MEYETKVLEAEKPRRKKQESYRVMCTCQVLKHGNDIYKYGDEFEVKSLEGLDYMITILPNKSVL